MEEDTVQTGNDNVEGGERTDCGDKSLLNRRDALKMGAAAAAVGLTGAGAMTGSAAGATERYGISFDRVVNAVTDLGLDPNGNEPIDRAVSRTIERGDVLIEFPPGTYYWEDTVAERGVRNWGIRGLGDHPTDVRFVSDEGASQFLLKTNGGRGILVENFAVDYGFDRYGSLGLLLKADDDLRVQDVHFVGFNPTTGNGAVDNLSPQALDSDGRVVVDGLVRTGPTDITSHGHLGNDSNDGCIWLGDKHVGELVIRNCHIENTGTNAIYARKPTGDVKVENSLFVNNNQTSLRIGGGGCHVKGCRFVVDTENATDENGGEFINPHAIMWETGDRGDKGGYIEDCDFIYKSGPSKTTAAVWVDGSAGEMAIRDSRFQIDADDVGAIRIDDPADPRLGDTGERPWGVTLDGVSVTGGSSGSAPAVVIENRDDSVIRNSCLQLTGNRDGIYLGDSDGSVIENTNVTVKGQATIFDGSSVSTSGITRSESCPVPNDSSPVGDGSSSPDGTTDDGWSGEPSLPNNLTVTGTGTVTKYEFSASGGVEGNGDVEVWDEVQSGSVSAWITEEGDTDTYSFSGAVGPVTFPQGAAEIAVNGVDVDPATLVADAECDHTLQIVPDGTSANYHLEVSGEVVDHPGLGTSLSKYDSLDGGVLDGWTTNDIDAVQFSGEVTAFSFQKGTAALYLDGEPVDASALGSTGDSSTDDGSTDDGSTDDGSTDDGSTDDGSTDDGSTDDGSTDDGTDTTALPNVVAVDGSGTGSVTGYEISVTGELEKDAANSEQGSSWDALQDRVSESSVVGVVNDGVDQYRFSGDIDVLNINGNASLSFEDNDG
jgi:hypothetical protein